jgi:uncharacterized membrane protein YfcA
MSAQARARGRGVNVVLITIAALATSAAGSLGGLGGAVILVPMLVVAGVPASDAAPLGLLSVAAGSIAAGQRQLRERSVNHRLGVVTESAASAGAVVGALLSGVLSDRVLSYSLAAVAAAAAVAGGRRKGIRNPPRREFGAEHVGEWPASLAGAYPLGEGVVPYRTRRLPYGLAAMGAAGVVAGIAGASGGFIKTPATSELMHVPVKVAASTTMFTIGITSSTALIVFALQGRIDAVPGAAAIAGSLVGGQVGAHFQARLSPPRVRRALSALLLVVAVVLAVRA